jgi:hypothetical protein
MIRRMLIVLVVALLALSLGAVPANAAYVFGPWTVTSPPPLADATAAPSPVMTDASCLSEDECVMTGEYDAISGKSALFTTVTGSTTITTRAPLPPDAVLGQGRSVSLSAIDCVAGVGCVATGSYPIWNDHHRVLIESRGATGGWTASTIPDAPDGGEPGDAGIDYTNLSDVACNVDWCVASGYAEVPFPNIPLLYQRDNTEPNAPWVKSVGVGPVAAATQLIRQLACPPQGYCVATGTASIDGHDTGELLVQYADGWHATVTAPPSGASGAEPNGVSCWAPGNCTALMGDIVSPDLPLYGIAELSLIDGRLQPARQLTLPAGSGTAYETGGLSCVSPGVCAGFGWFDSYNTHPEISGALLIDRDGSGNWTVTKAPIPASSDPYAYDTLSAVSCASPQLCVAAGRWDKTATGNRPLVEVRTTGGWEALSLELPISGTVLWDAELDALACAGARCVAAGEAAFRPYHPDAALLARSTALTG